MKSPDITADTSGRDLPETPRDLFGAGPAFLILLNWLFFLIKRTGLWKYPRKASGDFEKMNLGDKLYWLFKTTDPVKRACRGSDLESFFDKHRLHEWQLPPEFEVESELKLSAVGDVMTHPYLKNSAGALYANESVFSAIFGSDVSMANLECPVIAQEAQGLEFSFQTAPRVFHDRESFQIVKGCRGRRFTFMATACNHSLDFGVEGLEHTIRTLQREGILHHGTNLCDEDAESPAIIRKGGFTIGVVSFTFGLNGCRPPPDRSLIVNRMAFEEGPAAIDFSLLERQIQSCREAGVEFTVAQFHWGMEHEFYPRPGQIEIARHVAELGIDAVIGHHPHVVQPVEFYQTRRDPFRIVPIYYSLGNLVQLFRAPYLRLGGIAQITLANGSLPGGRKRAYVKSAEQAGVFQEIDCESRRTWLSIRPTPLTMPSTGTAP